MLWVVHGRNVELKYYAHTCKGKDPEELIKHLKATADLCEKFAAEFNNGQVGRVLGGLHDVGKLTVMFQRVLNGTATKKDHAIVAAFYYYTYGLTRNKFMNRTMCTCLSGHHSELYTKWLDFVDRHTDCVFDEIQDYSRPLTTRDRNKECVLSSEKEFEAIKKYIEENHLDEDLVEFFDMKHMSINRRMLYVRMLMSCLVDADYSVTANYEQDDYLDRFDGNPMDADLLLKRLEDYRVRFAKMSKRPMDVLRDEVYEACTVAGKESYLFRTLTAPTGSGKTLALIKYGLEQCKKYGKKRIFVVLPTLSIIEQNVAVYREIFDSVEKVDGGAAYVIRNDSQTDYTEATRLYAERWSGAIIVTTAVHFFETMFDSRAVNLRRLHQLANSVVIFDEAQDFPYDKLGVTFELLQELTERYNTTVLFSTATKLSYGYRNKTLYRDGQGHVKDVPSKTVLSNFGWKSKEIMSDVDSLFKRYSEIKHLNIIFDISKYYSTSDLTDYFKGYNEVLYVFNVIKHAIEMYMSLAAEYGENDCFLVTSQLCSMHKSDVVREIRRRLDNHEPAYVSSTQCIQAGVDLNFLVGASVFAPLDALMQRFGRVNRNGMYDSKFLVFQHEKHGKYDYPSQAYHFYSDICADMVKNGLLTPDNIYSPEVMDAYSKRLFKGCESAKKDSDALCNSIAMEDFIGVRSNYRLIENTSKQANIIVPYSGGKDLYDFVKEEIGRDGIITHRLMKQASPISVNSFVSSKHNPEEIAERLYFLTNSGEKVPTNWYFMSEKKGEKHYDKQGIVYDNVDDCFMF